MRRLLIAMLLAGAAAQSSRAAVDFLRDVRPILSGHCFKCHGPDEETRKGKLRLDLREEALKPAKSGEAAIVPGKPEASELIARILTDNEDDIMPPPAAKIPLTSAQKEILKQWIAEGAEYRPHWSFLKPEEKPLPPVKDWSWPRNSIDNFVLARLEKEGLSPSARADRHTLARRVALDLTGLPPTVEEADEFVKDGSPEAYEKMVDRLLASPHYGERWARRWLDLARYADTNGYEKDRPRSMWPWRDWVIQALNKDMPFDQFTIEQLAGDMLPKPAQDQIIATGFNRNSMINEEGGADPLEYRFHAMVDRVHVTSTAWLGLTMSCAQCHTHKFDPILHTEYYQFMALLNNADEPNIDVLDQAIAQKREKIKREAEALEAGLADRFPLEIRADWFVAGAAEFKSDGGAEGELLPDGSFRVSGKAPEKDIYTVAFEAPASRVTHVQIEALPDEKTGKGGPGRVDHGNFVLTELEMTAGSQKAKFSAAEADLTQDQFPPENVFDGKAGTGWAPGVSETRRYPARILLTLAEPIVLESRGQITLRLAQEYGGKHTLGRFRISLGSEVPDARPEADRRIAHRDRKLEKWLAGEMPKLARWERLRPAEASSPAPTLTIQDDDSVFASGDFTKNDTYTLKFRNIPAGVTAIRLEAMPDERLPGNGPGIVYYEGPAGDFWLSTLKVSADGKPVTLKSATQSYAKDQHTAAKAIDSDLQSGWSIDGRQGQTHNAVFQLSEALGAAGEMQIDLTFEKYFASGLGRFRIWMTKDTDAQASPLPDEIASLLLKYRGERQQSPVGAMIEGARDFEKILRHYVKVAPELALERKPIERLRAEMPKYPTTLVMRERSPGHMRVTQRHHRGEFLQPKEAVTPDVPSFLPPLPQDAPHNRLTFARWLVSPENPLTARVIMNRHWEAFFGRGLVRTMEDFGFQGELPTHPDLLDWLALEFQRQGWSQKKMHKLIVMSAAYQQSSRLTPQLLERDPQNLLLARGPRFRVEAELVRDATLVASGLFSGKMGGPSVFPPQPAGVTSEGAYGALTWKVSSGEDRYRRGLYTFAKRTAPFAMTATFDGPSGEACLARRDRSNTPLQALTLLNDQAFNEAAQALGKIAVRQEGTPEARLETLFRRCLTRPPTDLEQEKLLKFYQAQLARFAAGELKADEITGGGEGDAARLNEQAAWTAVARALLNLDEMITKS